MELPNELAEELCGELPFLMDRHFTAYNGPDWSECSFCRSTANDIKGKPQNIEHTKDCLGMRLRKALGLILHDEN